MSIASQFSGALEEGGFVIGSKGLERPSGQALNILPNRIYWMGASSSPEMIFVTAVSDQAIKYQTYPFDGKGHQIQTWIGKDLIMKGSSQHLATYGRHMEPRLRKSLDSMLHGGKGTPEKLSDWQKVYVLVKAAPGVEGDLWRDAERYGGVGGLEIKGVAHYEINTDNQTLAKIKKDKKFVVVKTGKGRHG